MNATVGAPLLLLLLFSLSARHPRRTTLRATSGALPDRARTRARPHHEPGAIISLSLSTLLLEHSTAAFRRPSLSAIPL